MYEVIEKVASLTILSNLLSLTMVSKIFDAMSSCEKFLTMRLELLVLNE